MNVSEVRVNVNAHVSVNVSLSVNVNTSVTVTNNDARPTFFRSPSASRFCSVTRSANIDTTAMSTMPTIVEITDCHERANSRNNTARNSNP
jgi:hypothetical protein